MVSYDACGLWRLGEFICFCHINDVFFVLDWTIRWVNTRVTGDLMFIVHHYTALIHRVAHHWTNAWITYSSLWSVSKFIHKKVPTRSQFTRTPTLCAMYLCRHDDYSGNTYIYVSQGFTLLFTTTRTYSFSFFNFLTRPAVNKFDV